MTDQDRCARIAMTRAGLPEDASWSTAARHFTAHRSTSLDLLREALDAFPELTMGEVLALAHTAVAIWDETPANTALWCAGPLGVEAALVFILEEPAVDRPWKVRARIHARSIQADLAARRTPSLNQEPA